MGWGAVGLSLQVGNNLRIAKDVLPDYSLLGALLRQIYQICD